MIETSYRHESRLGRSGGDAPGLEAIGDRRGALHTRLSSGTPAHTQSRSRNAPSRMIQSGQFLYWNKRKVKQTYRGKLSRIICLESSGPPII